MGRRDTEFGRQAILRRLYIHGHALFPIIRVLTVLRADQVCMCMTVVLKVDAGRMHLADLIPTQM